MTAHVLRRILVALSVALTVSVVSFLLLHLSGDLASAIAGPEAPAAQVEQIRRELGLDRPLPVQYADWLLRALQGDFGQSYFAPRPVAGLIAEKLPVTVGLGLVAMALALLVAVPLGVAAAVWHEVRWIDRLTLGIAVLGQATPSFVSSLLLVVVFAVTLRWLPVTGHTHWTHFVLPAIVLAFHAVPALLRLTRSGLLDVLKADYVRTARAKGLGEGRVVFGHALRNALLPVVALATVEMGFMLGGSVVVETIFALQGLGQLAWESIARNDFPVVQAVVLIVALFYVLLSFAADLLNAALDPRLRVG
jgi:peptide/nickel transport system permease protein